MIIFCVRVCTLVFKSLCGSSRASLEKEITTHSSILAWRIPWTGKPGGLPSMGSHRARHDWSDLAAAALSQKSMRYVNFYLKYQNYVLWLSLATCCCSVVWLCDSMKSAARQTSLSFTISLNLLKLMSIESVMPSNRLVLCRPLLFLPSILPSISLLWCVGSLYKVAKDLELQL